MLKWRLSVWMVVMEEIFILLDEFVMWEKGIALMCNYVGFDFSDWMMMWVLISH